jgi:hypothetical protein
MEGKSITTEYLLNIIHAEYPSSRVLNIYLFGSRVYGCATPDSDYDFVVIVDGAFFFSSKLIERDDVNLNLYHIDFYKDFLDQHILVVCNGFDSFSFCLIFFSQFQTKSSKPLLCLSLPPQFVYLETVKFPFRLKLPILVKGALQGLQQNKKKNNPTLQWLSSASFFSHTAQDGSHNFAKAKRLWFEGDIKKAKKNLVHALRYLGYSLQLEKHSRITDWNEANEHWKEVLF